VNPPKKFSSKRHKAAKNNSDSAKATAVIEIKENEKEHCKVYQDFMLAKKIGEASKHLAKNDDRKRKLLKEACKDSKTSRNKFFMKKRYREWSVQKAREVARGIESDCDDDDENSQASIFNSLFEIDKDQKMWKAKKKEAQEASEKMKKNSENSEN